MNERPEFNRAKAAGNVRLWLVAAATLPDRRGHKPPSSIAQDLLHRPCFGKFIDHLIKPPNISHQRFLDRFDPDATHHARDHVARGIHFWRSCEEVRDCHGCRQQGVQRLLRMSGQPADDRVDLRPGATLSLCLRHIGGVQSFQRHAVDAVRHSHPPPKKSRLAQALNHSQPSTAGCFRATYRMPDSAVGAI